MNCPGTGRNFRGRPGLCLLCLVSCCDGACGGALEVTNGELSTGGAVSVPERDPASSARHVDRVGNSIAGLSFAALLKRMDSSAS